MPFARRLNQNGAQSADAAGGYDRGDQAPKRRLLEDGLRQKQSLQELEATPAERQPPRRNPGGQPSWEEKLVSTTETGVPLLYVLPEDEQQGAMSGQLSCAVF